MIRLVLILLVIFGSLLLVYLSLSGKKHSIKKGQKIFHPKPKHFLGILLILLLVLSFGSLLIQKDNAPTKVYHPPEWRDGKIIPGHFE